jgi:hypothetical protein
MDLAPDISILLQGVRRVETVDFVSQDLANMFSTLPAPACGASRV